MEDESSKRLKWEASLKKIVSYLKQLAKGEELPKSSAEDLKSNLDFARNSCSYGNTPQNFFAELPEMTEYLQLLKTVDVKDFAINTLLWQFTGNLIVQNVKTQKFIWENLGETVQQHIRTKPMDIICDAKILIVYNTWAGEAVPEVTEKTNLELVADMWHRILEEKIEHDLCFLDLIFEYFLVVSQRSPMMYAQISTQLRIAVLKYIAEYVRNDSPNGIIRPNLIEHFSKEFKKKSECILKSSSDVEKKLYPQEVYQLLTVIAGASANENYCKNFSEDHSLFVSVSALLQNVVALGKVDCNQFTPMSKLEEVAPASKIDATFESEISFELKTLLIRIIGNLLHNNKINQQHCVDINLLPALLESTKMDARNPLVKEWSILAIRNACIECPEVQQLISELTQTGVTQNEVLSELSADMSTVRIHPRNK